VDGGEKFGSELLQGLNSLNVFLIKVASNDEDARGAKSAERRIIDALPDICAIPVILMPHEDDVAGLGELVDEMQSGGIMKEEMKVRLRIRFPKVACNI